MIGWQSDDYHSDSRDVGVYGLSGYRMGEEAWLITVVIAGCLFLMDSVSVQCATAILVMVGMVFINNG